MAGIQALTSWQPRGPSHSTTRPADEHCFPPGSGSGNQGVDASPASPRRRGPGGQPANITSLRTAIAIASPLIRPPHSCCPDPTAVLIRRAGEPGCQRPDVLDKLRGFVYLEVEPFG